MSVFIYGVLIKWWNSKVNIYFVELWSRPDIPEFLENPQIPAFQFSFQGGQLDWHKFNSAVLDLNIIVL